MASRGREGTLLFFSFGDFPKETVPRPPFGVCFPWVCFFRDWFPRLDGVREVRVLESNFFAALFLRPADAFFALDVFLLRIRTAFLPRAFRVAVFSFCCFF
ncbi:MAG: hypothetical protein A3G08_00255 [Candidatus Magasanikbacteria bacterium RIFCSPLOWO2_12_FULL_47_9b]|nr:MAG: hypothetical protein A3C10_02845 [Candidatus Magasanikbacteria bacterium RIFCSPHIGHO2_02_FULL_48_18]OGH83323.1 MAG: hypothetical protein A3G08_00255 [Candidatus Magasanikbacteria bacterium RIFCSPLOWO2_12_FULL_47_9b]